MWTRRRTRRPGLTEVEGGEAYVIMEEHGGIKEEPAWHEETDTDVEPPEFPPSCNEADVPRGLVDDTQKDWERLRRRYTEVRREPEEPPKSGSAYTPTQTLESYQPMEFLDNFVASQITTGNINPKHVSLQGPSSQLVQCAWDPLAQGVPSEVTTIQRHLGESRSDESSSPTSSHSPNLNLYHSTSLPVLAPSTPSIHHPIHSFSPSSTSSSNSLPASRMSSPEAFHLDKRQKGDSFESFLRTQISSCNSAMSQMVQQLPAPKIDSANKHFSNYLCELLKSVEPLAKKLECQQKIIEVISSFIRETDEDTV